MKSIVCSISIFLSLALLSCSKPVEQERKPSQPEQKLVKKPYILKPREITPVVRDVEGERTVQPGFMELKGRVLFDTGKPVDSARVWVEKHSNDRIDIFIRSIDTPDQFGIEDAYTQTDSNGFFIIRIHDDIPYYAVKATKDMHLPALAGIFTSDNPAPDFINLVIKSDGERIAGRFSDSHGNPVTNVHVSYGVSDADQTMGLSQYIGLEIQTDGSYLSQIIKPGPYSMSFNAPGYKKVTKDISVRSDDVTIADVIFPEYMQINGVVINPLSGEPIPGVTLSSHSQRSGTSPWFSPVTAADGTFWVRIDQYLEMRFSHPGYATAIATLESDRINSNTVYEVYLSPIATVAVHVDGIPPDNDKNYSVSIHYTRSENNRDILNASFSARKSLKDGTAVFTNVPFHFSPIAAVLFEKMGHTLICESKPHELKKDDTTHISLAFPPMGSLVVSLEQPYNRMEHYFAGTTIDNRFYIYDGVGCEINEKELFWRAVPTNSYKITFLYHEKLVYTSNVIIRAGEPTKIFIDFKTNVYGSIRGTSSLADSTPIDCSIMVSDSNKKHVKYLQSNKGEFVIRNLDPTKTYSLNALFEVVGITNITVDNVTPGDPPVAITLDNAYRISGNLVDHQGNPLSADALAPRLFNVGPGDFSLYPALPGTYRIVFDVNGYTPVERMVTVNNADVDLGDIVCYDKGYSISGTVVLSDGSPANSASVYLQSLTDWTRKKGITDSNGTFSFHTLSKNNRYTIRIRHAGGYLEQPVENITSDTDLGELKLNK